MFCLVAVFAIGTSYFFIYEFSTHYKAGCQIFLAEKYFNQKNYSGAVYAYWPLIKDYPYYKKGKVNLASSLFALSEHNEEFFAIGMSFLENELFSKEYLAQIRSFVPQKYQDSFDAAFEKESEK